MAQPVKRGEGAQVLETRPKGSEWRRGFALGRGMQPEDSGVSEQDRGAGGTPGGSMLVGVDAGKDASAALYREILITGGSETQTESHPPVGKPPPQLPSGVQPNHWQQRPQHCNHNAGTSVLTRCALNEPLKSYSDSWGFSGPSEIKFIQGYGQARRKGASRAGSPVRYQFQGRWHDFYRLISSPANKRLPPTPSTCHEK